ncbi:family 20 glycosylhydrolase [Streptacidiphilus sp. P02-A3a]|uniref:family 20 glycosylhydrolase n=1 Tax=Streptacidiphilus sp. P02-A3a TaxID=2704468 RepID=UPI001CDD3784|nr:family 20 glycosylhydrolase [Streptacidiphilus sp. P02-A3a]
MNDIVPLPVLVQPDTAASYRITAATVIYTDAGSTAANQVGDYLAGVLDPSTGYTLPVTPTSATPTGGIALLLSGAPASVGAQGYQLDVTDTGVVIRAEQPAGLLAGVETLRQILPAQIEASTAQPGPWTVPGGHILDYPRLAYRSAMLDVSRHFFTVAQVEQYLDQLALYKINYLHLHLSDDQGWRIAINGWPNLTTTGAATEAGGGPGGYYTQAQYQQIVAYAQSRYITIVPEIDMPGHFTAALASYGELDCGGVAPAVDTGTGTLGNSLCTTAPIARTFVDDVVGQLAAITPGPYIDLGGDESVGVSASDYATFMTWAQQDVVAHGKIPIGWDAITGSTLEPSTLAEYWGATGAAQMATAAANGTRIIMAPAGKAYIDQKYSNTSVIGLSWAGNIDLETAYGWDPATYLAGVPAAAVYGIEAPLWTETVDTVQDVDYQTFPRITAYAELGWSPEAVTGAAGAYPAFAQRVAAQGPRWDVMGITYEHSTEVPWPTGPTGPSGAVVSQENDTCLDTGTATDPDGAPLVQLDNCAPGAAGQQWTAAGNGTLTLGGQCLDVTGGSTTAGTPVELWTCDGGANQQWQTDGGQLLNPQSGLCLTVASGTGAPGSTLDVSGCGNSRAQWFTLPAGADGAGPTGPVGSGISGMCLDASDGNAVNLTPADLYTCNGTTAQRWALGSDGTIRALGMCLDVYGGGLTSGTKVELYGCESGDGAQQWRWSSNGTYGESLTNPQSGLCLDDPAATTTAGTQVQLYTCNGTLAQVWRLP